MKTFFDKSETESYVTVYYYEIHFYSDKENSRLGNDYYSELVE